MRKFLLIFILLVLFITPMKVKAEDKSYVIDKLNITSQITESGDVDVQEEITYSFHGSYNGIYRNLSKNGSIGHIVSHVSIRDKNNNIIPLSYTNDSKNNTYETIDSNDNTQIKIFSKSTDEIKTFIFNYKVLAAATKYTDFGELYWNFYKVENNVAVNNVDLRISLRDSKFDLNKFKYWSYVDGGEFNTNYDANSIHLTGNNLTSLLGIKVQFQPEFLKCDEKPYKNSNNQNIQNPPTSSNNNVDTKHNENGFGAFIAMALLIIVICIGVFVYRKNNRKFKEALEKYRGEFDLFSRETLDTTPSDLSPALVNFLYHEKYISNSAIPSTLFYLCQKGYYTLEKRKYLKSGFLRKDEVEDLCFVRNSSVFSPSSSHLKYFIKWFSRYEENGRFTLKSIEEVVGSRTGALEFKECFSEWEHLIKDEAEKLNFYTIIEGRKILNNKIYNERLKWLAYRQYLVDYFTSRQTISILNIDEALIYASALEISEIHSEEFSRKLNNLSYDKQDTYSYDMYNNQSFFLMNLYMWDSIDDSVQHNATDNNNNNNNDSGSGGGFGGGFGGFSGGGDFSGGGGGDSGAF